MSMLLPPGTLLDGRYEVVRCLGQGGMATVYEVKHTGLGSTHALKVLAPELSSNPEVLKRFLAEGRIQARLRHPNVVAVTEIVTEPVAGLVMEYVEGGTLAEWLAKNGRARTKEEVVELFVPVLDAVGEAHRQGVVHRDLKPENIILGRGVSGRLSPRVTDFGIARVAEDGARMTRTGARMGTLQYMSPEQVQGAESVDARSDIFALGAILYELVTGHRAFEGKSDFEVMGAIVAGRYPPVRERAPDVDPVLAEAIQRALEVKVEARFQSGKEFGKALEATPRSAVFGAATRRAEHVDEAERVAEEALRLDRQVNRERSERERALRKDSNSGRVIVAVALMGGLFLVGWVYESSGFSEVMVSIEGDGGIKSFKLDATEVTLEDFSRCVETGRCPSHPGTGDNCNWRVMGKERHPVNCVSWFQADGYCRAVGKRLPTEAEWKWAASNGGRTKYPWGDSSPNDARVKWRSIDGTAPVGEHLAGATANGVYDLSGNVWEWVSDEWVEVNSNGREYEVLGGSWDHSSEELFRVSSQSLRDPTVQFSNIGFRCAQ